MGFGLLAAVGLIVGEVWEQERFEDLRSQPGAVVLGLLLGAMALGATAAVFVRNPAAFAIAAFAVLPLRLPVQVGDETNFLLVPLYGVIAGGWLRGAWLVARGREAELQTESSPRAGEPAVARWLCIALAASLMVYALALAWSEDPRNAIVHGGVLPHPVRRADGAAPRPALVPQAGRAGRCWCSSRSARFSRRSRSGST